MPSDGLGCNFRRIFQHNSTMWCLGTGFGIPGPRWIGDLVILVAKEGHVWPGPRRCLPMKKASKGWFQTRPILVFDCLFGLENAACAVRAVRGRRHPLYM